MKKLVIGLGVLGAFVAYSLGIRHQSPTLSVPASLTVKAPSNSSTSTTGSAGAANISATTPQTYKDGTYTGSVEDAYYGNVEVSAVIAGGKITDVKFLEYPNTHDTSVAINQQAMPYLKQEAIKAQSAQVDIVSGATFTSQAFTQSLTSALSQAKA